MKVRTLNDLPPFLRAYGLKEGLRKLAQLNKNSVRG
jgi:hypothetical protein